MALDPDIRNRLAIPAVCAPMTIVSGPELVAEACKAGIMAGLPAHNARSFEEFAAWMDQISEDVRRYSAENPDRIVGPLAINLTSSKSDGEIAADLDVCVRHGVRVIISAMGNPRELVKRVHDRGGLVFHDVTTLQHAEKAIAAGVDGLTCIGAGGGGHSGLLSHLVMIPRIRAMFDGTIIMAGAVSNGAVIRAAEILGADLSYLGTRFIATQEARVPIGYKQMIVREGASGLIYTPRVSGVPASWMKASLVRKGLDPDDLPVSAGLRNYDHLPEDARPWRDLWSAGQGIELIEDIPTVANLVARLRAEYADACGVADMADAARLVGEALDAA